MTNATPTYRFDYVELGQSYTETPEGWLLIPARIARTGVQEYRRADGTVQREYRPPEEVGDPDSLASFRMRPVTLEHPPTMVNPENVSQHQVGHFGENVKFDGQYVTGTVAVMRRDAIDQVRNGQIRELSAGYQTHYDPTPGETADGTRYDGIQRRITGNHIALTRKGRAGPEVRLMLDSEEELPADYGIAVHRLDDCDCPDCSAGKACPCGEDHEHPDHEHAKPGAKRRGRKKATRGDAETTDGTEETPMRTELEQLRADAKKAAGKSSDDDMKKGPGPDYGPDDMDDDDDEEMEPDDDEDDGDDDEMPMAKGKGKGKGRSDSRDRTIAELQGLNDALYAHIETLEQRLQYGDDRADAAEAFDAAVEERVSLILRAQPVLGADYDYRGRGNREIMQDALATMFDSIDGLDERSDDYVMARFDAALELRQRSDSYGGPSQMQRALSRSNQAPAADDWSATYRQRLTEAYRKPLTVSKES
jgi:hypothetical protein